VFAAITRYCSRQATLLTSNPLASLAAASAAAPRPSKSHVMYECRKQRCALPRSSGA
jgi:hypothetical protein